MTNRENGPRDTAADTASKASQAVGETASQVGQKVSDTASKFSQKAGQTASQVKDTVDQNRTAAASGLEKAASAIHDTAGSLPGGDKVAGLAHAAADTLSSTAGYVREHDVNSMMGDVETLVKKNPGPALLAAAVIGFLVGRAFSGND